MKKRHFVFLLFIFSCADNNQKLLPGSSGNINNISVVINDELWDGEVGEEIRENFSRPIYGLPQIEPVFSLNHIPTKIFSGFATKSRTILKVDISEREGLANFKNTYASPQRIVQVTGNTSQKIITFLNQTIISIYTTIYFIKIMENKI